MSSSNWPPSVASILFTGGFVIVIVIVIVIVLVLKVDAGY